MGSLLCKIGIHKWQHKETKTDDGLYRTYTVWSRCQRHHCCRYTRWHRVNFERYDRRTGRRMFP